MCELRGDFIGRFKGSQAGKQAVSEYFLVKVQLGTFKTQVKLNVINLRPPPCSWKLFCLFVWAGKLSFDFENRSFREQLALLELSKSCWLRPWDVVEMWSKALEKASKWVVFVLIGKFQHYKLKQPEKAQGFHIYLSIFWWRRRTLVHIWHKQPHVGQNITTL